MVVNRRARFEFSTNVWVPDREKAFVLGRVVDIGSDEVKVELRADNGSPLVKSFDYDSVHPAELDSTVDMDDNCALMFLNPATLLNNVKVRYAKDVIYTYVANILVAVNPYKTIRNLYDVGTMQSYAGKSIGSMSPHVFAIGDKAYREMKNMHVNQSIIVSGESGSGKTESVKYILRYLTTTYGQQSGLIEERIIDSNPLLEAFGNAKTTRNNNSSRFGKFVELHFSREFAIAGGYISHYLLERTRVCSQSRGERNYHIFYQLCCAAGDELRDRLHLASPDHFAILNKGCTRYFLQAANASKVVATALSPEHVREGALVDIQLDDYEAFQDCVRAMRNMGLDDEARLDVFMTVAAIMHLGNVEFEPDAESKEGGCVAKQGKSQEALRVASSLLQLSPAELHCALVSRTMRTKVMGGRSGSTILVPLRAEDAMYARDALCKTIYVRLFHYLVKAVNQSIPPTEQSAFYIGMLDIAGFEYFPINSFEQFCINYCNERLQQFFNARILRDEQDLYEREGLGIRHIEYVDNQDCIDLIQARGTGILDLLDEESRLPQPLFTHFTEQVFSRNRRHARLDLPRKSHLKLYREIRDDEGFLVRHFAGAVVYSTAKFLDKNNDAIHGSLLSAVALGTRSQFLQRLFQQHDEPAMAEGKLNFISVGSKFRSQLTELLERLGTTGTSFVRCIKPNENMRPVEFDGPHILTQLQCAGMVSVLELMQQGFPSRAKFDVLYNLYRKYMPPDLARLDPRFFCKGLFHSLNMSAGDYRFGLTRVFFRPGKFAEFDVLMREDPAHLKRLIEKVRQWLRKARWRKAQYFFVSAIHIRNRMLYRRARVVYLQSTVRMFIQARRHRFRIVGLAALTSLSHKLDQMRGSELLVTDRARHEAEQIVALAAGMRERLLNDDGVDEAWVNASVSSLTTNIDNLLATAEKESVELKKKQEAERLRLEMERERERRKAEEDARLAAEKEMKKRHEIEERRRREEQRLKDMHADLAKAAAENSRREAEQRKLRRKEDQMKLDYHLAQRLATDTGSELDPMAILGLPKPKPAEPPKYNLSGWKYAQLRDTINTSCDLELLAACREEFHRRLKAYHQWKSKNKAKGAPVDRRVPPEIAEAIQNMRAIVGADVVVDDEQRFFRVALKDVGREGDRPNGMTGSAEWYAHFDGRWICRQIEVGTGRKPQPMVAGVDDIHMCELSLDETDLPSRKGAEILESDFDKVWNANGGLQYMAENYSRISSKYLQEKARPLVHIFDL